MRTEHEVRERLRIDSSLTERERQLLFWAMETCETCGGRGAITGCSQRREMQMCYCNGSPHWRSMGCH